MVALPIKVEKNLGFRRRIVISLHAAVSRLKEGQERERWKPPIEQLVRSFLVKVTPRWRSYLVVISQKHAPAQRWPLAGIGTLGESRGASKITA